MGIGGKSLLYLSCLVGYEAGWLGGSGSGTYYEVPKPAAYYKLSLLQAHPPVNQKMHLVTIFPSDI